MVNLNVCLQVVMDLTTIWNDIRDACLAVILFSERFERFKFTKTDTLIRTLGTYARSIECITDPENDMMIVEANLYRASTLTVGLVKSTFKVKDEASKDEIVDIWTTLLNRIEQFQDLQNMQNLQRKPR